VEPDEISCDFLAVGDRRAVIVAPAAPALEWPRSLELGGLPHKIVSWAQVETSVGPRLILLLQSRPETSALRAGALAMLPNLPRARFEPARAQTLELAGVGSALLSLLLMDMLESAAAGATGADIQSVVKLFDIEAAVTRETKGRQISASGPHFTFRTIIDQCSLPSGVVFGPTGRKQLALPIELKMASPDDNGRALAEIRAWVTADDAEAAIEASQCSSFLMLEGGRATCVTFV
jgi:hypothetical protein